MSSLNLNKVVLCGRLTADPELKQTSGGVSVLSFTLAVNRRYIVKGENGQSGQPQADFINLVAWRQQAEFISRFFKKGSALCVTGSIQTRSWNDQQGQRRFATEVIVDDAMFVDSRGDNSGVMADAGNYVPDSYKSSPSFSSQGGANFEDVKSDDDLPF